MGLIKDNNYTTKELFFAQIANALSHRARKKILELAQHEILVKQTQLPEILSLNKTSIHRHIQSLRKADLIEEYYFVHFSQIKLNTKTLDYFNSKICEMYD